MRGWDEFELEVVRDRADNVVIVCSIENLDPMGVHTGDSVTVAPQMTLSDEAYQELRDAAIAIVRAVGVDTGGSNIQFARERDTGELRVIEMNPRVSRSSALASKATGYPIAKVAAKLAVGYTLDEIPNDLTGTTPASFEPTLDYVVVKWPRFAFEKFPGADTTLGTQMKSVGESMGIGRTFAEAFVKARRGLDDRPDVAARGPAPVVRARARAHAAEQRAWTDSSTAASTRAPARSRRARTTSTRPAARPTRRRPRRGRSVVILGSGPNRIGQGIEFDYCCVHAGAELPRAGLRGRDGQLQPGDGLDRLRHLRPALLRAARRGGRARRARARAAGRRLHPVRRADAAQARARDRARRLPDPRHAVRRGRPRRGPRALRAARATSSACAARTGGSPPTATRRARSPRGSAIPVLVRPSYVLGGRAMRVCYDADARSRRRCAGVDGAVLVDRFLENAVELDVDALCDGTDTYVAAVMEHVEEAGHPLRRLVVRAAGAVRRRARSREASCGASGPRSASSGCSTCSSRSSAASVYVLEVNPRASRTVPFASKATGVNLVDAACRLAAGARSPSSACRPSAPPRRSPRQGGGAAVRALPRRRPGARARDALDRRGDGERGATSRRRSRRPSAPPAAPLPTGGRAFLSVRDADKAGGAAGRARRSLELGFELVATAGTASALADAGIAVRARSRRASRSSTSIRRRAVDLVVNTPEGRNARTRRLRDPRGRRRRPRAVHHDARRGARPRSTRSRTRGPRRRCRCRSGMRAQARAS